MKISARRIIDEDWLGMEMPFPLERRVEDVNAMVVHP